MRTKRTGIVLARILLLLAAGCGPRVTKARIVTPTPAPLVSEPVEPTPAPQPLTAAPARVPSPTPSVAPPPPPTTTRASPTPPPTATPVTPSPRPTATRVVPPPPPTATRVPPQPPTATRLPAVAAPLPTTIPAPSSSPTAVPAAAAPAASPAPSPVSYSVLVGQWRFRAETGERDIEGTLQFRLEDAELTGLYVSPNGPVTLLSNLHVSGNRISWDLVAPRATWRLQGTFSDTWMNGTFQTATRTVQWTATKLSGEAAPPPTLTPRP